MNNPPKEESIHFNRTALLNRCDGDIRMANKLLKLSKTAFATYIKNLALCIDEKDFNMSKSWAHTIKGAALNMSFDLLAQKAAEINSLQEPDFEKMKRLAMELKDAFSLVLNELTRFEQPGKCP
ncbi:MAG: Hpt domain-containing protein [Bacteroidales bacterium]|nr:Hpt domain-containing protein [Bacteroidales bacterium]MDZ4203822.1 Hpt domain-containing protein [Bacteroidales bacterium]